METPGTRHQHVAVRHQVHARVESDGPVRTLERPDRSLAPDQPRRRVLLDKVCEHPAGCRLRVARGQDRSPIGQQRLSRVPAAGGHVRLRHPSLAPRVEREDLPAPCVPGVRVVWNGGLDQVPADDEKLPAGKETLAGAVDRGRHGRRGGVSIVVDEGWRHLPHRLGPGAQIRIPERRPTEVRPDPVRADGRIAPDQNLPGRKHGCVERVVRDPERGNGPLTNLLRGTRRRGQLRRRCNRLALRRASKLVSLRTRKPPPAPERSRVALPR